MLKNVKLPATKINYVVPRSDYLLPRSDYVVPTNYTYYTYRTILNSKTTNF